MHQQLIRAFNSSFDKILDQNFKIIENFFEQRQLHVMFETTLNCNPKTDHLMPKNVFPIYKDIIMDTKKQIQITLLKDASDYIRNIVKLDQLSPSLPPENDFLMMLLNQTKKAHQETIKQYGEEKGKLLTQVQDLKEQIYSMWKSGMCYAPDFMEDFFQKADKDDKLQLKVKNALSQQHTKEKSRMAQLRNNVVQQEKEFIANIEDLGPLQIADFQQNLQHQNNVVEKVETEIEDYNHNFVKEFNSLEDKEKVLERQLIQVQSRARDLQIELNQSQQLIEFLKSKVPQENWDSLIKEQKGLIDNADKQRHALDQLYSQDSKLSFELQSIQQQKKDLIDDIDFVDKKEILLNNAENIVKHKSERNAELLQDPSKMSQQQIIQLQKEYNDLFNNNDKLNGQLTTLKQQCDEYMTQISLLEDNKLSNTIDNSSLSKTSGKKQKKDSKKETKKDILDTGVPKGKKNQQVTPKKIEKTEKPGDRSQGLFSPQSATRNKYLNTGILISIQTELSLLAISNDVINSAAKQNITQFVLDPITGKYVNKLTGEILSAQEFKNMQQQVEANILSENKKNQLTLSQNTKNLNGKIVDSDNIKREFDYDPETGEYIDTISGERVSKEQFKQIQKQITSQNLSQPDKQYQLDPITGEYVNQVTGESITKDQFKQKQQEAVLQNQQLIQNSSKPSNQYQVDPTTGEYIDSVSGKRISKQEFQKLEQKHQQNINQNKPNKINKYDQAKDPENYTFDPVTGKYINKETGQELTQDQFTDLQENHKEQLLQYQLETQESSYCSDQDLFNESQSSKHTKKFNNKDYSFDEETQSYINKKTGEILTKSEFNDQLSQSQNPPPSPQQSNISTILSLFNLKFQPQDSPQKFIFNNNLSPTNIPEIRDFIESLRTKQDKIADFESENIQFHQNLNDINEAFNLVQQSEKAQNFGVQVEYGKMLSGSQSPLNSQELNTYQHQKITNHFGLKPQNSFLKNYYQDVPGDNVYEKLFNSAKILKQRQQDRIKQTIGTRMTNLLEKQLAESVVFGQKFFYQMEFQDDNLTLSAQEIMKAEGENLLKRIQSENIKISTLRKELLDQEQSLRETSKESVHVLNLTDLELKWNENIQNSSVLYLAERKLQKSHLTKSTYKFLLEIPGDTYKNHIKTSMQQRAENYEGYMNKSLRSENDVVSNSRGSQLREVHSLKVGKNLPVISPPGRSRFPSKAMSSLEVRGWQQSQGVYK